MNFTSPEFLLFFPLVVAVTWRLPHRMRWLWLLLASWVFYLWGNFWAGALLAVTTLTTWLSARKLARADSPGGRLWLIPGVGAPLLALAVFKYAGFFVESGTAVLRFLGLDVPALSISLLLPVGISFYTFQSLSYVVDVWKGEIAPEEHLGYYALYISFFPQLVAGPIERPGQLLPQLRTERQLSGDDLHAGLWRLLRGFCKKVVAADWLAGFVEPVFAAPESANGPTVLFGTVCFALQIYCDFSGYSDIAVGAARLLGIRLMENFKTPYRAESIQDFWRRWHISLTGWFTDYLYIPLGGRRRGTFRHCVNLMVVFLVSGLWHGADWSFVLWGGLHGVYLVCAVLGQRWDVHPLRRIPGRTGIFLRRAWVFTLTCLAWVFFRADSVRNAVTLLSRLGFGWGAGGLSALGLTGPDVLRLALTLVCLHLFEAIPEGPPQPETDRAAVENALAVFFAVTLLAVSWLALLSEDGNNVFLYFRF